ncbi:MAG: dihydroorotate dehydrogenase electron transfer subunit [Leptospirales bacterium]|nr:dihydroorotate dehydrogenase electron transfer subunit [Leptospirales bacterium]
MPLLLNQPELLSKDHYLLKIEMKETDFYPGQFINIKASHNTDPLLRRPISIFDAEGNTISIVVRVIGKGTELISRMEPGDIDIIGPLGKGFTIEKNKNVLLIGGGVGNAPLYYLMKILKQEGTKITYIYSVRNKDFIFEKNKYQALADDFIITTDDGSEGIKGIAIYVSKDKISSKNYDRIYCCGPDPMMEKVVQIADISTPVEISVENYFGCGVGICVGCTIDTIEGYKRACIDGPVFDARTILWDKMPTQ